jgi:hypothetical protein
MKTYWLCKSYRLSMCRCRCITHQGKLISTTGSHNHAPHVKGTGNVMFTQGNPNVLQVQNVGMDVPMLEPIQQNHQMVQPMNTSDNIALTDSDFERLLNDNLAETNTNMEEIGASISVPSELQITPVASQMKTNLDISNMLYMGDQNSQ